MISDHEEIGGRALMRYTVRDMDLNERDGIVYPVSGDDTAIFLSRITHRSKP